MKNPFQITAAVAAALLLTSAVSQGQILYGSTFFNNELITFDVATGDATQVGALGPVSPYGLASRNSALYTFDPNVDRIRQIDPATGTVTGAPINIGVGNLVGEGDLAFRADGIGFLASGLNGDTFAITNDLFSFNILTGTSTRIGTTGVMIDGLAFSPNGTLFALGQGEGRLFTVDTTNGTTTIVGELGVPQESPFAALTFGPNGTLYAAIDDVLYTLNTTTGAATPVNPNGTNFGSVSGLAFGPIPEPSSTALLALGSVFCALRRRRA